MLVLTQRQTDRHSQKKKIRVYISDDASFAAAVRKKKDNPNYSSEIFCLFVCFCIGWEGPRFNAVGVAAANTKKNGMGGGGETEKSKKKKELSSTEGPHFNAVDKEKWGEGGDRAEQKRKLSSTEI